MTRKSILILVFILLFSFSSFAQIIAADETTHIVYISSFYNEESGITELKNQPKNIFKFGLSDSNKIEEKICDALMQFAKEENIKLILNADEVIRDREKNILSIVCGDNFDNYIDVTDRFIEYYNTHFAKK